MGVPVQAMRHDVRPMYPGAARSLVGRCRSCRPPSTGRRTSLTEVLFEAFRAMRPNDVLVITTTGHYESGVWGGLLRHVRTDSVAPWAA